MSRRRYRKSSNGGNKGLGWLIVIIAIIIFALVPGKDKDKSLSTEQTKIASTESVEKTASTKVTTVTAELESQTAITTTELRATAETKSTNVVAQYVSGTDVTLDSIPAYSGNPYVTVNDNVPFFTDEEMSTDAFEYYSNLDSLGRCGVAYANVCTEIMPTEERGAIGSIKPSGWHTVKYDIVNGKYLYNRCHLIGYQLSAENANTKNLITGTRYLNTEGMLPFENMVADYVKETNNHVLYRVTPMFSGDNLVASGVLMEAKSVEDNGAGILYSVYCYNVQPGVSIDYATGESSLDDTNVSQEDGLQTNANNDTNAYNSNAVASSSDSNSVNGAVIVHITDSGSKYHSAGCRYLKSDHEVTLDEAKSLGLSPCSVCNPPQEEGLQTTVNNDTNADSSNTIIDSDYSNSTNGSVIVHITNSGSKYHRAGCRYLKSDNEVTLDEARSLGLSPCSVCNPPQ